MENKGLTKKQFWLQIVPHSTNALLGAFFLYKGFDAEKTVSLKVFNWVAGGAFIIISAICIVALIIRRRRHLIEDAEMDKEAGESIKSVTLFLIFMLGVAMFIAGLVALFLKYR
jgi:uncharacterized membrane protein